MVMTNTVKKIALAELSRFDGIVVFMVKEDNTKHKSPHFHARYSGDNASYELPSLSRFEGYLPKNKEKILLEWCNIHLDELQENWELLTNGLPPKKIEPLRKSGKYDPYHKIIGFRIIGDYTIEIYFNDGFIRIVDFYPFLKGPFYGQLRDLALFNQVHIRHGGNLYWPNDVEWSSDDLYHWDKVEENYRRWMENWKD